MAKLYVNVDHVATLRQQRDTFYPDPVTAAALAELAGADGITIHLREDRRHVQERDALALRQSLRGVLNLEMAATPAMVDFAKNLHPDVITLVPEKRQERTTEGGLDLDRDHAALQAAVKQLHNEDIAVSLFIDPSEAAVQKAEEIGVRHIELHTGRYCESYKPHVRDSWQPAWQAICHAATLASERKLHVAAGHGLDYANLGEICRIALITEFNIGHSIICQAVMVGMDQAVRSMLQLIRDSQPLSKTVDRVGGKA